MYLTRYNFFRVKLFSRNLVTRAVGDQEYATEIESKRWEEFVETVDRDMGLERRRGASTAGTLTKYGFSLSVKVRIT